MRELDRTGEAGEVDLAVGRRRLPRRGVLECVAEVRRAAAWTSPKTAPGLILRKFYPTWYALRTITTGNPVAVPAVALMAVRIKASGQLSGALEEVNVVARSICRDWDDASATWLWRPSSQPGYHDPYRSKR